MWSDKYYYLNIYKDELLSEDFDTNKLREFIAQIPELIPHGEFEFRNKDPLPFIKILMLKAKNISSWSDSDTNSLRTNLISIVCTKGEEEEFEAMKKVFIKIAAHVNWTLVDEETEEGFSNYRIWSPNQNYL